MMQKIPLKLAAPGMTLAKPVVRDNGITLVGEGVELTPSLLARFEQSGIASVTVEGSPVRLDELAGGTDFGRRVERLDFLFRKHENDAFMVTLKKVIARHFHMRAAVLAAEEAARAAAKAAEGQAQDGAAQSAGSENTPGGQVVANTAGVGGKGAM